MNNLQLAIPFPEKPYQDQNVYLLPEPTYQVAEIGIVYKSMPNLSERPMIKSSRDSYNLFMATCDDSTFDMQERFRVMYLNRANYVLGIYNATIGGINSCIADPRLIMVAALKANASAMILSHNHPSSALKPSRQDEDLTQRMMEAGSFLDIKVLDHIICTRNEFYSFADHGLL